MTRALSCDVTTVLVVIAAQLAVSVSVKAAAAARCLVSVRYL